MSHELSSALKPLGTSLTVAACVLGFFCLVWVAEQRLATSVTADDLIATEAGFVFERYASVPAAGARPEQAYATPNR